MSDRQLFLPYQPSPRNQLQFARKFHRIRES